MEMQYVKITVKIVQQRPKKSIHALYFRKEGVYIKRVVQCIPQNLHLCI